MESNPTDQELYPIRAAGVVSRQPQPAADGPAAGALAAGRSATKHEWHGTNVSRACKAATSSASAAILAISGAAATGHSLIFH